MSSQENNESISPEEKKKLQNSSQVLKDEIKAIKDTLNTLNEKKEKFFEERKNIRSTLGELREKSEELKHKRDALTKEVKGLKVERDKINNSLKAKSTAIASQRTQLDKSKQKFNIKDDPYLLKKKIERLEFQIETEALPFDKEKKIMKEIHSLKDKFSKTKGLSEAMSSIKTIGKDIRDLRSEGKNQHLIVQKKAADSQKYHEELIKIYAQMDELRPKETTANNEFLKLKEEFNKHNVILKERINDLKVIQQKLGEVWKENKKEKKRQEEKKLKDMEMKVEDKIKQGRKLTVDDLLVFQKTNLDEEEEENSSKKDTKK